MTSIKNFSDLTVWQKAHILALDIYKITKKFPNDERFGLTNQLRRAAVSIPSNIAEGFERKSNKEFCQFLTIARGSVAEVQTQLLLANDLDYINEVQFGQVKALSIEVHKMLNGLLKSLQTSKLNTRN